MCILSLVILTRLAYGFDFNKPPDTPTKPGEITGTNRPPPQPPTNGQFSFVALSLGSGLYDGQYVTSNIGELIPNGLGTLVLAGGVRHLERFNGWWNKGIPANGEYRFANGWKWYGNLSDPKSGTTLLEGNAWLPGLTFDDAERRAREAMPPSQTTLPQPTPTATTGAVTSSVDVVVITDPGQVTVIFAATDQQREQTSDAEGNLQLSLPAGNYHLTCEKPGFQRKERDLVVGADGSRIAFCRVKLDGLIDTNTNSLSEEAKRNIIEEAKRVVGAETFPFFLGQTSPDTFVYFVRDRARKIQSFLKRGPAVAQQPEIVQEVDKFWRLVAQNVIEGYRTDKTKAVQVGRLDGNRSFLATALGALAADCEAGQSQSGKDVLDNWNHSDAGELFAEYLPLSKSDHLEPADLSPQIYSTNYIWREFPREVQEQSLAARILPRMLEPSLEDPTKPTLDGRRQLTTFKMMLVPDVNGSLRLAHEADGNQNGSLKDETWRPAAPFYMAVTETSFAQMRLYADWAKQQLVHHPEQAKWFMPIPVTKQLVGAQNLPYMGVTLDEALSFCNWLSFSHGREPAYTRTQAGRWTQDLTKASFRLPNENEWEYAARFGFDFVPAQGASSWKQMRKSFGDALDQVVPQPDRRLVFFAVSQTGASPRSVDDPQARLYPLGLRDLCGNVGELCLAGTTTADVLHWTVRGGDYTSTTEDTVMPWHKSEFKGSASKEVGFRVILPVPMENFVNE